MSIPSNDIIELKRAINVIMIPSGETSSLPGGTPIMITQALGGTFTITAQGKPGLYRVAQADADALGLTSSSASPASPHQEPQEITEAAVWNQLKTCYDPEIPVNIVDLGLIYNMRMEKTEQGHTQVYVEMTLTAPGCGMGPSIAADAREKILSLPGIQEAQVELVWDPPWGPERISEEGKTKLGMA